MILLLGIYLYCFNKLIATKIEHEIEEELKEKYG